MNDVYLILAVAGGTLLGLQILLQLLGLGHHDIDMDHAHDVAGGHDGTHVEGQGNWFLGVLSLKTVAAFAGVFGLTGLALGRAGMDGGMRLGLAAIAGFAAMFLALSMMRGLSKLSASGTVKLQNSIGKTGTVYLKIPGRASGPGKVNVELQGRVVLLDAVTDGEEIPTGAVVEVVEVLGDDTIKVVRAAARRAPV